MCSSSFTARKCELGSGCILRNTISYNKMKIKSSLTTFLSTFRILRNSASSFFYGKKKKNNNKRYGGIPKTLNVPWDIVKIIISQGKKTEHHGILTTNRTSLQN